MATFPAGASVPQSTVTVNGITIENTPVHHFRSFGRYLYDGAQRLAEYATPSQAMATCKALWKWQREYLQNEARAIRAEAVAA